MTTIRLGAVPPDTKMMRVKIELRGTDIRRTIVVPGNLSLFHFSFVLQAAIGWDGDHEWKFYQGKDIDWFCDVNKDEPRPPKNRWSREPRHLSPRHHTLNEVLPSQAKGKRLYYVYDFGDWWEHVVYRMADPQEASAPVCEKTSGTWGRDDLGGASGLNAICEELRKWDRDCTDHECREGEFSGKRRFWYGWGKKAIREQFLAGPSPEEVSAKILEIFSSNAPWPSPGEERR